MQVSIRDKRRGFTLIELLVVLAILALLVSLSTAAVMKFRVTGVRGPVAAQVRSLTTRLASQMQAVRDKANKDSLSNGPLAALVPSIATWAGLPSTTGANDPRIRAAYIQLCEIRAFPQTISEALNPPVFGSTMALPAYTKYLAQQGVTAGAASPTANESAVCLLMALTYGPGNSAVTADNFANSTQPLQVGSTNVSVPGLVDGWRRPIIFSRNPTNPATVPPPVGVVMSAGPDGNFGVDVYTQAITTVKDVQDNLSSLNVQ